MLANKALAFTEQRVNFHFVGLPSLTKLVQIAERDIAVNHLLNDLAANLALLNHHKELCRADRADETPVV